ncbi:MAG TPA: nucleotidyltransferase domain-containing protein [Chloroflexia bacterium]|nr:nucleotidyltransferase domain-containing protein [Chloroflexia bacterium]
MVAEAAGEDIVGTILGGSHARGTATLLSDVDIALFVRDEAALRPPWYLYRDGVPVSIGSKAAERVRADIAIPPRALPGE